MTYTARYLARGSTADGVVRRAEAIKLRQLDESRFATGGRRYRYLQATRLVIDVTVRNRNKVHCVHGAHLYLVPGRRLAQWPPRAQRPCAQADAERDGSAPENPAPLVLSPALLGRRALSNCVCHNPVARWPSGAAVPRRAPPTCMCEQRAHAARRRPPAAGNFFARGRASRARTAVATAHARTWCE